MSPPYSLGFKARAENRTEEDLTTQLDNAKCALRRQMRACRAALSSTQRTQASHSICAQLHQAACLSTAQHVALYYPCQHEVNLLALMQHTKQYYLPAIVDQTLEFRRYSPTTTLIANAYHIPEPPASAIVRPAHQLDSVLVPLLAVTRTGQRLGMGKGFYDRCFAFKQAAAKPLLIGVAYDCQIVEHMPSAAHDVRVDALCTETQFVWC